MNLGLGGQQGWRMEPRTWPGKKPVRQEGVMTGRGTKASRMDGWMGVIAERRRIRRARL